MSFKAAWLEEQGGKVTASVKALEERELPPGDVVVRVEYSTLNYKDGLILGGLGRLVRQYPHAPASISPEPWRARARRNSHPATRWS